MKYAITSAIYIFGVILGLTVLVLLLVQLVPMAVSGAVADEQATVLQDETALSVLGYAALVSAGLWATANIQHFVWTTIRGAVRGRSKTGEASEEGGSA